MVSDDCSGSVVSGSAVEWVVCVGPANLRECVSVAFFVFRIEYVEVFSEVFVQVSGVRRPS